MAEESSFDDLNYGMDRDHAVLSDHNLDDEFDEDTIAYNKVPDTKLPDDPAVMESHLVDFVAIREALEQAGKDFGIPITEEMENYVLSLSSTLDTSGDALAWFVAAISFQTNMKTLPNMIGLIEDLRAEVKSLQGVNRSLTVTSGDIIKKMTGVKDDILSGFEGLRRSVLDKIVAIPTQVEAAVGVNKIDPKPVDKGKGINPSTKQIPPPAVKQEWVKKEKADVASSSKQAEMKEVEAAKTASLASAKLKYLKKLGADPSLISALPDSVVDKLIKSDELMILVEQWGSEAAKQVMSEVDVRVMLLENNLLS